MEQLTINPAQIGKDRGAPVRRGSECQCGCATATMTEKARYLPGHDARHVSRLAQDFLNHEFNGYTSQDQVREEINNLGDSLANKCWAAIARRQAFEYARKQRASKKAAAKASRGATADQVDFFNKTARDIDPVKIGRWLYPARQDKHGNIFRNIKTDGSGEWVAA